MASLAFCLYRCTPFGGLERNALELARAAVARGHAVTLFTRRFEGELPAGLELCELPVRAWTNIGRDRAFARALRAELGRRAHDAVVGFNLLPELDVYYAADPCRAARGGVPALPNRRQRAAWERALAAPAAGTELLVLSERERACFQAEHGTPETRMHLLPPGLRAEFLAAPMARAEETRAALGIPTEARVVLALGSDFARKGLDRTLTATALLPEPLRARTWLVAVGAGRARRFERMAQRLGLAERVRFVGGQSDVRPYLGAADLFVHPAREENTGTVLLEAMSQELALVCSAECGFAPLVAAAGAGRVLAAPFDAGELARELAALLADDAERAALGARGRTAALAWPMQRRTDAALAVIERAASRARPVRLA